MVQALHLIADSHYNLRRYGYKECYQKTFEEIALKCPVNISKSLKEVLKLQKSVTVGNIFPLIDFINTNLKTNYIQVNKYTLVEFWFSGCGPCIGQFDSLIKVYDKYKNKKFEILAISIDGQESIPQYNKILDLKKYPWKQLLDSGGKNANTIEIHKFPTSFLLDRNGKILEIDIKPASLEIFLNKNL